MDAAAAASAVAAAAAQGRSGALDAAAAAAAWTHRNPLALGHMVRRGPEGQAVRGGWGGVGVGLYELAERKDG